jgi:hypothetical protein
MAMSRAKSSANVLAAVAISLGLLWGGSGNERHPARATRRATVTGEGIRGLFLGLMSALEEASGTSSCSSTPSQPGNVDSGDGGTTNSGSSLDPNG